MNAISYILELEMMKIVNGYLSKFLSFILDIRILLNNNNSSGFIIGSNDSKNYAAMFEKVNNHDIRQSSRIQQIVLDQIGIGSQDSLQDKGMFFFIGVKNLTCLSWS